MLLQTDITARALVERRMAALTEAQVRGGKQQQRLCLRLTCHLLACQLPSLKRPLVHASTHCRLVLCCVLSPWLYTVFCPACCHAAVHA